MSLRSLWSTPQNPLARLSDDPFSFLQRSLQQSLGEGWRAAPMTEAAASLPVRLDVKEDEQAYHVTAELPGLTDKDVEVTFDDGILTIRGEKKVERDEKNDTWHIVERSSGSFARRLSLPANVDAAKVEARFEKGLLSIALPKVPQEQATTTKISIKSA